MHRVSRLITASARCPLPCLLQEQAEQQAKECDRCPTGFTWPVAATPGTELVQPEEGMPGPKLGRSACTQQGQI